jgi:hypothetical protein
MYCSGSAHGFGGISFPMLQAQRTIRVPVGAMFYVLRRIINALLLSKERLVRLKPYH